MGECVRKGKEGEECRGKEEVRGSRERGEVGLNEGVHDLVIEDLHGAARVGLMLSLSTLRS